MLDLILRRRRSSHPGRSAVTRWVGRLEAMEERVLLSGNGLINQDGTSVPAVFGGGTTGFPAHTFAVTSVLQDTALHNGFVPTPTVDVAGYVHGPFFGNFTGSHEHLAIEAFEGTTAIGTIDWPDLSVAGPQPNPSDPTQAYFYQGTAARASSAIPAMHSSRSRRAC